MEHSTSIPPDAAPTYSVRVVRPVATNVATQRGLSLCGKNGKTDLGPALGADWCEFREMYIREGSSYTAGRGIFEGEVKSMGTCADLRLTALFCALFACHAPNTHTHTHIKIKTNGLAL